MKKFHYKTQLSLKDWEQFKDDEDIHYAIGRIAFLSTRPNSHKHVISEEVLRQYASTFLNKLVIAEYSEEANDVQTHTDKQVILGFIPKDQEIEFEVDDEGYVTAYCLSLISKLYATDVYQLFKEDDNFRNVSVEMLTGFSDDTKDLKDGIDTKEIIGFEGCAITILGKDFKPSVPNANIQMVQFSENLEDMTKNEDVIVALNKYSQVKTHDVHEVILQEVIEIKKMLNNNGKENPMDKKDIQTTAYAIEIGDGLWFKISNAIREKYGILDAWGWLVPIYSIYGIYEEGVEKYVILCDGEGKYYKLGFTYTEEEFALHDDIIEVQHDFVEVTTMTVLDKEAVLADLKTSTKEDDDDDDDDDEEIKVKIEELTAKNEELMSENATLKASNEELVEYKEQVVDAKKQLIIDETMSKVKDYVDESQYATFMEEASACSYEEITSWKNATLASITEVIMAKVQHKEEGVLDFGANTTQKQSKYDSIYK